MYFNIGDWDAVIWGVGAGNLSDQEGIEKKILSWPDPLPKLTKYVFRTNSYKIHFSQITQSNGLQTNKTFYIYLPFLTN